MPAVDLSAGSDAERALDGSRDTGRLAWRVGYGAGWVHGRPIANSAAIEREASNKLNRQATKYAKEDGGRQWIA